MRELQEQVSDLRGAIVQQAGFTDSVSETPSGSISQFLTAYSHAIDTQHENETDARIYEREKAGDSIGYALAEISLTTEKVGECFQE